MEKTQLVRDVSVLYFEFFGDFARLRFTKVGVKLKFVQICLVPVRIH